MFILYSIYCLLSLIDLFTGLVALFLFLRFYIHIYIFIFPFSPFVNVYAYASLCDFVCIGMLLPFVLGFSLLVFLVFWLFLLLVVVLFSLFLFF